MNLRNALVLGAATGIALLASLIAGCDDAPPTRHADFADSSTTRFSEFRGPYGPYYIRPGKRRVVETSPPDPALAIQVSDSDADSRVASHEDTLLGGGDALTGERYNSEVVNRKIGMDNGFSHDPRRKLLPSPLAATPYSMATPAPTLSSSRLRAQTPLAAPSAAGHPDAAEKRRQIEEQTRRAFLLSQPNPIAAPTPAPAKPTPAASTPSTPTAPSTP